MSISPQKTNQLKSIAIVMMLVLHLFNRDYKGLFEPLVFVGSQPLSYYISLFCDMCVAIFAFVSGYGLYFKYRRNPAIYDVGNRSRLKKLYINYWVIIMLFVVILGLILGKQGYPGSLMKLFLNVSAIDPSYNGTWWFLTTYILFVLTSGLWFRVMERMSPYVFFVILLLIYFIAFYFRVYRLPDYGHEGADWMHRQAALYFCTLSQFMVGAMALRYSWNEKVRRLFSMIRYRNSAALLGILLLIVFHAFVPNFILAAFTGLAFIFLFLQLHLPPVINRVIDYFTPHATNIWLIHMFFYGIYYEKFIYSFTYTVPIFMVLLTLSLLSSYIVNFILQLQKKQKPIPG